MSSLSLLGGVAALVRSLRLQEGFLTRRVGSEAAARARSLRTQVCLQYDAKQVAVASLFLAFEELKLAQLRVGGREWWSVADKLHPAMTCAQMLGARPLPNSRSQVCHCFGSTGCQDGLLSFILIYIKKAACLVILPSEECRIRPALPANPGASAAFLGCGAAVLRRLTGCTAAQTSARRSWKCTWSATWRRLRRAPQPSRSPRRRALARRQGPRLLGQG